jgi:hypothetical protein
MISPHYLNLLAKLNVKYRDAVRSHILTLLQDEDRHPVQHSHPLHRPHLPLHRVSGQPLLQVLPRPQAAHGIFSAFVAKD